MKNVLIGCGVAILLAILALVALFGSIFFFTSGAADAADAFFARIAEGDIEGAYASTAEEFRADTPVEEFGAFLETTALSRFESATWNSRSVENNRATISGTITTTDGGRIPMTVGLVKEQGEWRVLSVKKADAGLVPETAPVDPTAGRTVPDDATCEALARDAMASFAGAVVAGDFTTFHEDISLLWRSQTTPEALEGAFSSFIDQGIDLRFLADEPLAFSEPPSLDEQGVLRLVGYYGTADGRVSFDYSFVYEHPEWRLIGIQVDV
jgi:hypothetical protein